MVLALLLMMALPVVTVLAAPDDAVVVTANPQDTSITLTWITGNATSTIIRYKTTSFPANPSDGTLAYNGTGFQTTITGLTAGTAYFISVWGFDGVSYSPNPAEVEMNTLAVALPTGGVNPPTNVIPIPTVPAGASSNASIAGFDLEPFTSIIAHFNNAQGGLGMPISNAWQTIATLIIVFIGLMVYRSNKNFFVAYFVVFILSAFAVGLNLQQWYLLPIEIVVGLGVWALERFFQ